MCTYVGGPQFISSGASCRPTEYEYVRAWCIACRGSGARLGAVAVLIGETDFGLEVK